MKMKKVLYAAVLLIIAVALFSCADNGGSLSLLGVKKAGDLQNFDGTEIVQKDVAFDLLKAVFNDSTTSSIFGTGGPSGPFMKMLVEANDAVYKTAFQTKYNTTSSKYSYLYNQLTSSNTSASVSVDLKDNDDVLKSKANVTKASINGSSNSSRKYSGSATALRIESSTEESIKKTFAITDGFYSFTTSGVTYKAAGYITVEAKDNLKSNSTYGTDSNGLPTLTKSESSGYELYKVSAALTISKSTTSGGTTTTTGGKFIISYSSESSDKSRYSEGSGGTIYSDIQVYDNNNTLLWTITTDEYDISYFDGIAAFFID